MVLDVTDAGAPRTVFAQVVEQYGGIDVLVNNAGIIAVSKLEELSLEDWNRVLSVNTTGTFLCARGHADCRTRAGL